MRASATIGRPLITFTTDFGTADWFVGTMKGVAFSINPRVSLVDLTHEVPPGDLRAGAFALMAGYGYFPKGSVHVAVVDPGVGSQRRAIAVQTNRFLFVGPDNGVLSWALTREKIKSIRRLENSKYFLKPLSSTFHGRDIFVPVAAHLSVGLKPEQLGPELHDYVRLTWPQVDTTRGKIRGEIVYIDRFGNAITNIEARMLSGGRETTCEVIGIRRLRCRLAEFYGAVPTNRALGLIGSSGFLEIAVNGGSAAERFGLKTGDTIKVFCP